MAIKSFKDWQKEKNGGSATASSSSGSVKSSSLPTYREWSDDNNEYSSNSYSKSFGQRRAEQAGQKYQTQNARRDSAYRNTAKMVNDFSTWAKSAIQNKNYDKKAWNSQYSQIMEYLDKYGSNMGDVTVATLKARMNQVYDIINPEAADLRNAQKLGISTPDSRSLTQQGIERQKTFSPGSQNPFSAIFDNNTQRKVNSRESAYMVGAGADLSGYSDDTLERMRGMYGNLDNWQQKAGREYETDTENQKTAQEIMEEKTAARIAKEQEIRNRKGFTGEFTPEDYEEMAEAENSVQGNKPAGSSNPLMNPDLFKYAADSVQKEIDNRQFAKKYNAYLDARDFKEKSQADKELGWQGELPGLENIITDAESAKNAGAKIGYTPEHYLEEDEDFREKVLYSAINGDKDAQKYLWHYGDRFAPELEMSDKEVRIFDYLYNTEGKDAAHEYLDGLKHHRLNKNAAETHDEYIAGLIENDPVSAIGLNILGTATKPFVAAQALGNMVYDRNTGDRAIDPYDPKYSASREISLVRSLTGDKIKELSGGADTFWGKAAGIGYDTVTSVLDNLYGMALGGAVGKVTGLAGDALNATTEAVTLGIMGLDSTQSSIIENLEAGLSQDRAVIMGLGSGIIEVLTEKIGLDNLFNSIWKGKDAWISLAKQMLSEGGEELVGAAMNDALDIAYDVIARENQSDIRRQMNAYIIENNLLPSQEGQALAHVLKDKVKEYGLATLEGSLSGGIMGGGAAVHGAVQDNAYTRNLAEMYGIDNRSETVDALVAEGLSYPTSSNIYRTAAEMQERADQGKKVSNRQVRNLYGQLVQAQPNAEMSEREASADDYVDATLPGRGSVLMRNITSDPVEASSRARLVNDIASGYMSAGRTAMANTIRGFYVSGMDAANYVQEMGNVYNAALMDQDIPQASSLTEEMVEAAVLAAEADKERNGANYAPGRTQTASNTSGNNLTAGVNPSVPEAVQESGSYVPVEKSQAEMDNDYNAVVDHASEMSDAKADAFAAAYHDNYAEDMDVQAYTAGAEVIYRQAQEGQALENISLPAESAQYISNDVKAALYDAAMEDIKGGSTYVAEEGNVPLYGSSRRNDGQSAGFTGTAVAEGTGRIESTGRYTEGWGTPEIRNTSENAAAATGREGRTSERYSFNTTGRVETAQSLGISNGNSNNQVQIVELDDSPESREIKELASRYGKKIVAFAGNNLSIDTGTGSARGAIQGDTIYVRADHPNYSATQIAKHEAMHAALENHTNHKINQAFSRLEKVFGESFIREKLIPAYKQMYRKANMGDLQIMEEILCDIAGEMNVFQNAFRDLPENERAYNAILQKGSRVVNESVQTFNEAERTEKESNAPPARYSMEEENIKRIYIERFGKERSDYITERTGELRKAGKVTRISVEDVESEIPGLDAASNDHKYIRKILSTAFGKNNIHFDIHGNQIEAYLTREGKVHYTSFNQRDKEHVSIARNIRQIITNAEYLFSNEHDGHSKTENISTWDKFISLVEIGNKEYSVIFSVRKMESEIAHQIYAISAKDIKKEGTGQIAPSNQNDSSNADYMAFSPSPEERITEKEDSGNNKFSMEAEPGTDDFNSRYMELAKNPEGNEAELRKMVEKTARLAGYDSPVIYHGTNQFGFTKFDPRFSDDMISLFTTTDNDVAQTYSGTYNIRKVNDRPTIDYEKLDTPQIAEELNRWSEDEHLEYRYLSADDIKETISKIPQLRETITDKLYDLPSDVTNKYDRQIGELFDLGYNGTDMDFAGQLYRYLYSSKSFLPESFKDLYNEFYFAVALDNSPHSKGGGVIAEIGTPYYEFMPKHEALEFLENISFAHRGNYALYGKSDNMLKVDAGEANWNHIPVPEDLSDDMWNTLGQYNEYVSTRTYARYAKDKGYEGVIIENVWDNGGRGEPGSASKTSDLYIFFDPSSLKSADPVTYDLNGNIIPLDQRFMDENPDIRYSQDSGKDINVAFETTMQDAAEDLKERVKTLEHDNKKLEKRYEYFKGQTQLSALTKGSAAWQNVKPVISEHSARSIARDMLKDIGSTAKANDFVTDIQYWTTYLATNRGGAKTFDDVNRGILPIAKKMVENAQMVVDSDGSEILKDIRNTKIKISPKIAAGIQDYAEWRKAHMGRMSVSLNSGTDITEYYQMLQDRWGSTFPELETGTDQLLFIADFADNFKPITQNPYSYDMAGAVQSAALQLYDRMLNADVFTPTFADKSAARMEKLKSENQQRLQEVRKAAKQQRDDQIKKLKDHHRDVIERQRARKDDSTARQKLLKLAKRLDRISTTKANRTLINDLIGNLDKVAVTLTDGKAQNLMELNEWYQNQKENNPDFVAHEGMIQKQLARLNQRHISEMTLEEVKELTDALMTIENDIRNQNRLLGTEDKRNTLEMGMESIRNIDNAKGTRKGKLRTIDKLVVQGTLSPVRFMHRLTGYVDSDPLYQAVAGEKGLAGGELKMLDYQRRAEEKFRDFLSDKKFTKWFTGTKAEILNYDLVTADGKEMSIQMTPAMRTTLYLASMDQGWMQHMCGWDTQSGHTAGGGIILPDIKSYRKGNLSDAYSGGTTKVRLTKSFLNRLAADMTPQERAFADAIHDYFSGMSKDEINATSELLLGRSIAEVGDYLPISVDTNFLGAEYGAIKYDGTIEGMGNLKERQTSAKPVVVRDITDILKQSIESTSKYVGLAIPIRNFNKLMGVTIGHYDAEGNYQNFEGSTLESIANKWGDGAKKYIEKMVSDLQTPNNSQEDLEKAFARIRSKYAGAVLTLNLSVAMKQAASYPTAAAILGWRPLLQAFRNAGHVDLDFIAKYTPLQWYRTKGFSTTELGDIQNQNSIHLPKGLNWIQGVDLLTTRKLWKAAEYYVKDNNPELYRKGAGERGQSDTFYRAVADIYNQVITETQPNYTSLERPEYLRSKSGVVQTLMMFKTQPMQNFNVLYDAAGNFRAKRAQYRLDSTNAEAKAQYKEAGKKLRMAVSSQIGQLVTFAAMTMLWNMFRRKKEKYTDEDGNFSLEVMAASMGKDIGSGLFGMVPFGSEAWSFLSSKLFGETYYGFESVTDSAIGDFLASVSNAWTMAEDLLTSGEPFDFTAYKKKIKSIVSAASKMFGWSFDNMYNTITALYKRGRDIFDNEYLADYYAIALDDDPSKRKKDISNILYQAYRDGDKEAYGDLYQILLDSNEWGTSSATAEEDIDANIKQRFYDDIGVSKESEAYDYLSALSGEEYEKTQQQMLDLGFAEEKISKGVTSSKAASIVGTESSDGKVMYPALYQIYTEDQSGFKEALKEMITAGMTEDSIKSGLKNAYEANVSGKDYSAAKAADAYEYLYGLYKSDNTGFKAAYQDMINVGYSESAIKSGIESIMKEEQGVDNVKKLTKRFEAPTYKEPSWWTKEEEETTTNTTTKSTSSTTKKTNTTTQNTNYTSYADRKAKAEKEEAERKANMIHETVGVNSSWIGSIGYDEETGTLTMTTKGGRTYTRNNISKEQYLEFKSSDPGRYWNSHFK